jgi:glutamate dehydrogenase/leucine dehydrogenase
MNAVDKAVNEFMAQLRQDNPAEDEFHLSAQQDKKRVDYVDGANIAGFTKVADTLLAYGIV